MIQPLSYVHPNSKIAENVVIDPFVTIEKNVEIGSGTWIGSNVTIMEGAIIGKNCKINIRVSSKGKKIFILFEDNGPGFPKNAINKIFDRFYTDRINQKEFGKHSGLGLSISKQIISAHNGNIFAENIINDDKKIIGARVNIILNKQIFSNL